MRVCIIFNPMARGEKARHLVRRLKALDGAAVLKPSGGAGEARKFAAQAVQEGFELVVAAGGDGTVNEVLNGLGDVPNGFDRARLGILPMGTVNVFARELGFPLELEPAWKVLCSDTELRVDLPWATFETEAGVERRHFVQLAGAGLDARAIEQVDWQLKKRTGPLAYVVSGFQALKSISPTMEIELESGVYRGELVLIGNGRFYGGQFHCFPRANLQDGILDVVIFPRVSLIRLVWFSFTVLVRRLEAWGGIIYQQSPWVKMTAPSRTPFELEGDTVGRLPVQIGVNPRQLRLAMPRCRS